jgi:hypothetical protein
MYVAGAAYAAQADAVPLIRKSPSLQMQQEAIFR